MNKVTKIEHEEFSYFKALHDSFIINAFKNTYLLCNYANTYQLLIRCIIESSHDS